MRWSRGPERPSVLRVAIVVLLFPVIAGLLLPAASAQDDVEDLEELKSERDELHDLSSDTIALIDVANATVEEVTQALDELNAIVRVQESRLQDAERALESARDAVATAREGQLRVADEMVRVRAELAELAVASFTGEQTVDSDDMTELALSEDPGEASRFRHLLELQTGSLTDGLDRLRALEVEVELLIDVEEAAEEDAEVGLELVEKRTASLEFARNRQSLLVQAAETQLEARLAEAAFLEERNLELATEIRDQQEAINQRIASVARTNGVEIPPPVDLDDIVLIQFFEETPDDEAAVTEDPPDAETDPTIEEVPTNDDANEAIEGLEEIARGAQIVFSIEVHSDIEEQTRALFTEAFEQGIELAGWGYRPIQRQIELRAAHCGGTEYDIWHKPVFECAPPTARPGFSKHEQGRAIDFTFNGASITSQNSAGFQWLAAHAPKYGFVNLESEPWHWSLTTPVE